MSTAQIRKSYTNVIGSFPSFKLRKTVHYSNTLIRDFLYFAEYDAAISSYEMEPFTAYMTLEDGKVHAYTPTLRLIRNALPTIVEIAYLAKLEKESVIQEINMGRRWAGEHDHGFQLFTDRDILQGSRLDNLKILFRYCRLTIPADILISLQKLFIASQQLRIPFGVVAATLIPADPAQAKPYAWSLLFHRYLETDLEQKMSDANMLSPTERLSSWAE